MDEGVVVAPELIMAALKEEKAQLEKRLETETDESERQTIQERITEIYSYFNQPVMQGPEPQKPDPATVRHSERVRRPTEKQRALLDDNIQKRTRKFMSVYLNFKAEVQFLRLQLKEECSKDDLEDWLQTLAKWESDLTGEYEALRALTTPTQDIRRKIDSCVSVTAEVSALLKRRSAEAGTTEFDPAAAKAAALQLLKREDAKSIYGSTVSRAERGSQQGSQASDALTIEKVRAAVRLASKKAEINNEEDISAQREELRKLETQRDLEAKQGNTEEKLKRAFEVIAAERKLSKLEKQRDLEVVEAEYNAYVEEELKLNSKIRDMEPANIQLPSQPVIQRSSTPILPSTENKQELTIHEVSLVQALQESLTLNKLPAPEPFIFTGDPLKFIEWSTCFKALIESSCKNSAHRLYYLKRYISGEALSVLEGTFYRSDDQAYVQAWDALNERYGHPFMVQRAFREKLNSWPKIGPRDSLKLREFSDFLISCNNAMPYVEGLNVLNDCEQNQRLLQKLPDFVTTRWNRQVTDGLYERKPYPGFKEFANFVASEARAACNPITSLYALRNEDEKSVREPKHSRARVLATTTEVSETSQNTADSENSHSANKRQIICTCCQQNHFIYKCETFAALSLDEKKKCVMENKMCFGCLRVGHISKNCRNRATCNLCRGNHPSPLHEENQVEEPSGELEATASTVSCSVIGDNGNRTSMTVPVWLSSADGTCPETLVYALLDTQSSNTFIDLETAEKIQADAQPVKLKLSTLTDRGSVVKCQRVTGLRIRGYFSQVNIDLPSAYTREYIPLEQNSIPTRKTAKLWTHLHGIAEEMPDLLDCPVGLLIGYDCARALKPTQVISGKDYEPYAVRTDLGWSVVGSITRASSKDVTLKKPCTVMATVKLEHGTESSVPLLEEGTKPRKKLRRMESSASKNSTEVGQEKNVVNRSDVSTALTENTGLSGTKRKRKRRRGKKQVKMKVQGGRVTLERKV